MWDGSDFSGTKIALVSGEFLVVYLRDEKDSIPFPGMWDLPGGGREGDESPEACVLREVLEEFGLNIPSSQVTRLTRYKSKIAGGRDTYFCIARITQTDVSAIRFGDEGQRWQMMPIADFLLHDQAIPDLKVRLQVALSD